MRKSAPLFCALLLSLSARRAWIEIMILSTAAKVKSVALRKESVDRNAGQGGIGQHGQGSLSARRAWIEIIIQLLECQPGGSLSARRAWIEIMRSWSKCWTTKVALRKESVDRNLRSTKSRQGGRRSLSARRAWIEITQRSARFNAPGRSPQGERG